MQNFSIKKEYMKRIIGLMLCVFTTLMGTHITASAARSQSNNQQLEMEIGPAPVPGNKPYTVDQVRKAIIYAAMGNHWAIESETSGEIRIKLDGRNDHIVLVMDILYDANSYSIKYVSSDVPQKQKLNFNAAYSRWMRGLKAAIDRELTIINL
ncbi:MAG TPA: hypothetical protein VIF82_02400 [Burkholderiaceae bacterium]|jgi:hypothetical protein